jgi:iron-sulfur cluster insertion protein
MSIDLTDSAAARALILLSEADEIGLKLRVFVKGGGCSGFNYGITFDTEQNDDDFVFQHANGLIILVDASSNQYLEGAILDYVEDIMGSQFVFKNPNATSTCGCGSSFSV